MARDQRLPALLHRARHRRVRRARRHSRSLSRPACRSPLRLDFFGDTLESIRAFDPETQRTTAQMRALDLVPMSEVQLTTETIRRFRQAYVAAFGAQTRGDTLYEAVSEGRRHAGMEHWLPLFYGGADTLFDYLGDAPLMLDPLADDAVGERLGEIQDYYDAAQGASGRRSQRAGLQAAAARRALSHARRMARAHRPLAGRAALALRSGRRTARSSSIAARAPGRTFARRARRRERSNVFEAAVAHIRDAAGAGQARHRRRLVRRFARAAGARACRSTG